MNKNPLWLPKGSIRALIVLILVAPIPILLLRYGFYKEEIPLTVKDVVLVVMGYIFAMVKDYFASRVKDEEEEKPIP